MNDKNEENQELKNNTENNQQDQNNLKREDSPNLSENESNKIMDKDETISESTQLKVDSNNKTEQNNDFYHDKDITEDSIIYFTNKLKTCNKNYKCILYFSILIYIIDIFIWFCSIENLNSYPNILFLLIILISSIHQAFAFKHNFESISKSLYNFTKQIMYAFGFIFIVYTINILYILVNRIIDVQKVQYYFVDKIFENNFVICYCIVNIFIPGFQLFRLISVKKAIKDLSSAKGEVYESGKIEDVEIINSVINEI